MSKTWRCQSDVRFVLGNLMLVTPFALCLVSTGCTTAESQEEASFGLRSGEGEPGVVVVGPSEADHLWVFPESKDNLGSGGEFHIYVDPETHPEARASFAKFALGEGGELPVHRHDKTEEIGYFLEGKGVVTKYVDGEPVEIAVEAGHVVYIPPGTWHTIKNTGQGQFSLVFATIPNEKKGLLSFFRRISVKPGDEGTPLPPEEFAQLAAEHDMILKPAGGE